MAFKLDKQESQRRATYVADLQTACGKIEDAINAYNEAVSELKGPVEQALADYNAIVEQARGFAEDVANRADGEFDDKSEKWQEGEKGRAAAEWRDAWQGIDLEEIDGEVFPDELTIDAPSHADDLEGLPEEADNG